VTATGEPPTRIDALLAARATEAPEHVFIETAHERVTLRALLGQALALAGELEADGVRRGDRVLVVAENCPEHVALIFACARIGAWACGVNARMSPGEVAGFDTTAEARIAYCTAGVSDAARMHAARLGATRASVLAGLLRTAPRDVARVEAEPLASAVAALIFTSGTTGVPKGVPLTHAGLLQFARVSATTRGLRPDDRSYAFVPMTHIFGLGTVLMASLHAGACLVMRPGFDPAEAATLLAQGGITQLLGPPAMYSRLLAHLAEPGAPGKARPPAPALRYLYTGAAPLTPALKAAIEARFGQPLQYGYGLSEYAGSICLTRRGQWRGDTAAGFVVEGGELRIVDAGTGQDLPPGQRGEIWLRGLGLMPGYFRNAEATAQVMRPGGWYASGDIGEIGPDGALHVVGRLKEMIVRSGFNVYPGEIEAVLTQFPDIQRAAVIGRALEDGNEEVLAFVEPAPGTAPDLLALNAHLRQHLAPYKRPARVTVLAHLPTTVSGKILKRELLNL
jgi:acyl-CoA synthetase (AMP-forming)/AMP-acid ligase II